MPNFASRSFARSAPLLALVLLLPFAHRANAAAADTPPVSYYGIYLSGVKLGWETITRDSHALRDGVPVIRTVTESTMVFMVAGATSKLVSTETSWVDAKTGVLLADDSKTESAGHVTETRATYSPTGVDFSSSLGGQAKNTHLALPSGKHFLVDPTSGVGVTPQVGMKAEGLVLAPSLSRLVNAHVDIVGKENVTINGQSVSAFKVIDANDLESATMFADDAGDALRIDLSLAGKPMQVVKETRELALAPVGTPINLAAATSNHPVGASLADARRARTITYRLSNVSRPLPASDTVETIDYVPATAPAASSTGAPAPADRTADVTIHATPLPDAATAPPLFASPQSAPADLQTYLLPTQYVESTDPRIRQIAQSLVGKGGANCVDAATKIAAYVHRTVKADPSITSLRPATDVCRDPRGVCRDYTVLFAAIARAAGLPTKQCFGIVFDGQNFVGHAWPEVWTGKDATGANRWTAIEPTWGVPYADATHLKMAEGDVPDFYFVSQDMTRYKIDVLKVE